ncbi:MAG: WG repeat-containing protein [Flavobacteriales bacterium]|nr:WG repeat-containing protein [Flavobacteriales bacterium]
MRHTLFFFLALVFLTSSVLSQRNGDAAGHLAHIALPDSTIVPFEDYANCYTGFKNGFGDTIFPAIFDLISSKTGITGHDRLWFVRKDMKWGVLDNKGTLLIDFIYDDLTSSNHPSINQQKYFTNGTTDSCGQLIHRQKFQPLLKACLNEKCGLIDLKGEIHVNLNYLNVKQAVWLSPNKTPYLVYYVQKEKASEQFSEDYYRQVYDEIIDSNGHRIFSFFPGFVSTIQVRCKDCTFDSYLQVRESNDEHQKLKLYHRSDLSIPPIEAYEFEFFCGFIIAHDRYYRFNKTHRTSRIYDPLLNPISQTFKGFTKLLNARQPKYKSADDPEMKYLLHYDYKRSHRNYRPSNRRLQKYNNYSSRKRRRFRTLHRFRNRFYKRKVDEPFTTLTDFEGKRIIKQRSGMGTVNYFGDSSFFVQFLDVHPNRKLRNSRFFSSAFLANGEKLFSGKFINARYVSDSPIPHFIIRKNYRLEYWIDLHGNHLYEKGNYRYISDFNIKRHPGILKVVNQQSKTGLIDLNENVIIPIKYQAFYKDWNSNYYFAKFNDDSMDVYTQGFNIIAEGVQYISKGPALDHIFNPIKGKSAHFIVRAGYLYQLLDKSSIKMDSTNFKFNSNLQLVTSHFLIDKSGKLFNHHYNVEEFKHYYLTPSKNKYRQELVLKNDAEKIQHTVIDHLQPYTEDLVQVKHIDRSITIMNFKSGNSFDSINAVVIDQFNNRYWYCIDKNPSAKRNWIVKNDMDSLLSDVIFGIPIKINRPIQTYVKINPTGGHTYGLIKNDFTVIEPAIDESIIPHWESNSKTGYFLKTDHSSWTYINSKLERLDTSFRYISAIKNSPYFFVLTSDSVGKMALMDADLNMVISFSTESEMRSMDTLIDLFLGLGPDYYLKKIFDKTNPAHVEFFLDNLINEVMFNHIGSGPEYAKVSTLDPSWNSNQVYPIYIPHTPFSKSHHINFFSTHYASVIESTRNDHYHRWFQTDTIVNYAFTSDGAIELRLEDIFNPDQEQQLKQLLLNRINREQLFGLNCLLIDKYIEDFKSHYVLEQHGIKFMLGTGHKDLALFFTVKELGNILRENCILFKKN